MDTFTRDQIERLMEAGSKPRVSIYLTTHATGADGEQDAIRLKNLLRTAEDRLIAGGMRAPVARDLLEVAGNSPSDKAFWNHRDKGLAIFIAADQLIRLRLPIEVPEVVVVGDRYHIKPLVKMLDHLWRGYLLSLSQNEVALYELTQHTIKRVDVPGLPVSMRDSLAYDGADRGEQVHSAMAGSLGKQAAVFHGQGGARDTNKDDLLAFCRMVNDAVNRKLRDSRDPLVLACVDYVVPIYRKANSYHQLLENHVPGNQAYRTETELHQLGQDTVGSFFVERRNAEVERFRERANTPRALDKIDDIVIAARDGRVDVLFVDSRATVLGRQNATTGAVEVTNEPGDDDLIDLAIIETLRCGGKVYSSEDIALPTNSPVAAIPRYY